MYIEMYVDDVGRHYKPHIHVKYAGRKVPVGFDGKVLVSRLPSKKLRKLRKWIKANRGKLDEAWELAVKGERFEFLFDEVREASVMYGVVESEVAEIEENTDDLGESAPSTIVALRILPEYRIWARFYSGEEKLYDFTPQLDRPVLKPLRDKAFFDGGYLDGGTVNWDTGRGVRMTDLGFWDDGTIGFDPCAIYESGIPTPESALTPEERACPLMDKDRSHDKEMEMFELDKFFESNLSEEDYDKLYEKFRGVWDPRELLREEKEKFLRARVA